MLVEQSVGVIPVRSNKTEFRFLLIRHAAGHWGFPKGHAEETETLAQTAEREFYEETGLKFTRILRKQPFEENYTIWRGDKAFRKTVKLFLVKASSGKLQIPNDEILDGQWLSYEESVRKLTYPESQKVLRLAHQYLLQHPDVLGV